MTSPADALAATRVAVDDLKRVAAGCSGTWTTARAPGKWSPSRVVEHIALSLESSADEIAGRPSRFPRVPAIVRPLARMFMRRVIRTGRFIKARTNPAMDPPSGPASPGEGQARLDGAFRALDEACRHAADDTVDSRVFGKVDLADYLTFQRHHVIHHTAQMTW